MKTRKQWMAVILTIIMTLSMAMSAFAAVDTGSLTVNVNTGNTLENQTITLYRLFNLPSKYDYKVNPEYKDILKKVLELADSDLDDKYVEAMENKSKEELETFAEEFTQKALEEGKTGDKSSGVIGAGESSFQFADLPYGHYLVHQTGTQKLQSSMVTVDGTNADVNLKGTAPSIQKKAEETNAGIGDVITYTIKGMIPDTTGYDQYIFKVHDTLSVGLDFVEDKNGTKPTGTNYKVKVKIENGTDEEKTAILSGTGSRTMELDLSDWIKDAAQQAAKGQNFVVTYYAKVNQDALEEVNNEAKLEYGNKPGETVITPPVSDKTPNYPLDINKTDANADEKQRNMLADAVFRLYEDETDAKAGNDNAIRVTGTAGSYKVAEDQTITEIDMRTVATAVGTGYNLRLAGLADGVYWLREITPPQGYNELITPIKITITTINKTEWTLEVDNNLENDKIVDIQNSMGTILPETGGLGTILFTFASVVMIIGVAASFVVSRRNDEKKAV